MAQVPGYPFPFLPSLRARCAYRGCPLRGILLPFRRPYRGLPHCVRSIGYTGSRSSSCPESARFPRRSSQTAGLPQQLLLLRFWRRSQVAPRPRLRLCRGEDSGYPDSHLSAVPIALTAGCPAFRSFGIADDSFPGLPRFPNPAARLAFLPGYPGFFTFRFASGDSPSLPGSSLLWSRLRSQLPGCPGSSFRLRRFQYPVYESPRMRSPTHCLKLIFGLPRISVLWLPPALPRVASSPRLRLGR